MMTLEKNESYRTYHYICITILVQDCHRMTRFIVGDFQLNVYLVFENF